MPLFSPNSRTSNGLGELLLEIFCPQVNKYKGLTFKYAATISTAAKIYTIILSVSACTVKLTVDMEKTDACNLLSVCKKGMSYVSFSTALVFIHELTKLHFFV